MATTETTQISAGDVFSQSPIEDINANSSSSIQQKRQPPSDLLPSPDYDDDYVFSGGSKTLSSPSLLVQPKTQKEAIRTKKQQKSASSRLFQTSLRPKDNEKDKNKSGDLRRTSKYGSNSSNSSSFSPMSSSIISESSSPPKTICSGISVSMVDSHVKNAINSIFGPDEYIDITNLTNAFVELGVICKKERLLDRSILRNEILQWKVGSNQYDNNRAKQSIIDAYTGAKKTKYHKFVRQQTLAYFHNNKSLSRLGREKKEKASAESSPKLSPISSTSRTSGNPSPVESKKQKSNMKLYNLDRLLMTKEELSETREKPSVRKEYTPPPPPEYKSYFLEASKQIANESPLGSYNQMERDEIFQHMVEEKKQHIIDELKKEIEWSRPIYPRNPAYDITPEQRAEFEEKKRQKFEASIPKYPFRPNITPWEQYEKIRQKTLMYKIKQKSNRYEFTAGQAVEELLDKSENIVDEDSDIDIFDVELQKPEEEDNGEEEEEEEEKAEDHIDMDYTESYNDDAERKDYSSDMNKQIDDSDLSISTIEMQREEAPKEVKEEIQTFYENIPNEAQRPPSPNTTPATPKFDSPNNTQKVETPKSKKKRKGKKKGRRGSPKVRRLQKRINNESTDTDNDDTKDKLKHVWIKKDVIKAQENTTSEQQEPNQVQNNEETERLSSENTEVKDSLGSLD